MKAVKDSWTRVSTNQFPEKFYNIFLDADPRFRPLFKKTDFNRQKDLLLQSIFVLLDFAAGNAIGTMAMNRLGGLHSRTKMDISPDMYAIWLSCFIKVVSELDPKFSPELDKSWRKTLQKGIDFMISRI